MCFIFSSACERCMQSSPTILTLTVVEVTYNNFDPLKFDHLLLSLLLIEFMCIKKKKNTDYLIRMTIFASDFTIRYDESVQLSM